MHKSPTLKKLNTSESIGYLFSECKRTKKARGCVDATLSNYDFALQVFKMDTGLTDDDDINCIDEDAIIDWIDTMKNRGLHTASINHYLSAMRAFINWCIKKDYIDKFEIVMLKEQDVLPKFYSDKEMEELIKRPNRKALFTEWRTWALVSTILATGARAGTCADMRVSDINFERKEIVYRHLKNKQVAIVPLSDALAKTLKDYLRMWKRSTDDGYLFCTGAEEYISPNGMRQALDIYCKKRGVRSLGLHALRHSFARGWVINGGNSLKLQRMLTHSSLEMTKRYVKLFNCDLKDDFEEFSTLDKLSKNKSYTISR